MPQELVEYALTSSPFNSIEDLFAEVSSPSSLSLSSGGLGAMDFIIVSET